MPNFRSTSNSAKPVLVRLSTMLSIKKRPYSYAKIDKKNDDPTWQQTETALAITWDINKDGSPYPGLMHFTRKYAPVFFGREALRIRI